MIKDNKNIIAYVSTFPPRECGIATFTADLTEAFDSLFAPRIESRIIAMNQDDLSKYNYSDKVIYQISQNNKNDYLRCATEINKNESIKLIHIEHEFGIYGDNFGSNLLFLIKEIKKSIVVTMHTILPNPRPEMRQVIREINENSRLIFVMTKTSKQILMSDYAIPEEKIKIVPHGIHHSSFSPSQKNKKMLGLKNKIILSTFGLLGPGKGIEYAIDALPNIIKKYPDVIYLIIGATHPVILKNEGETYRKNLIEKIKTLNLEKHVYFYNEYFTKEKLLDFLKETDVYLSLSLDPNQAVSGTLSYALGAGRPVISTSFAQAKEDVDDEIGYLVDFRSPIQIEQAIFKMLADPEKLKQMSRNSYFRTRNMVWKNVALSYMREIMNIIPELNDKERNSPKIKLQHIIKMTDDFGIFQFAKLTEPDSKFGYTLDDNSRALIAVTKHYKKNKDVGSLKLAKIYLEFINYAYNKEGFNNYINYDKTFNQELNDKENLEDSHARSLYALAEAASDTLPIELKKRAEELFIRGKNKIKTHLKSPRAISYYVISLCEWHNKIYDKKIREEINLYCEFLINLYKTTETQNWQWFEDILAYSNGIIPEALLSAYKITGDQRYFNIAKTTLDFLLSHSFKGTVCIPIGQEKWFKKGTVRTYFDQQPEEVTSLVSALNTIYDITKEHKYREFMLHAFNWFLGNNLLNQVVYDQETGGCYDGVQEKNINLNQGAESTISYLLARLII